MLFGYPVVVLSAGLLATIEAGSATSVSTEGRPLVDDLRSIAGKRIYFAHQSVGSDLLEGLRELAREAGIPLSIVEGNPSTLPEAAGIVHGLVGENTKPLSKLDAFVEAMRKSTAGRAHIAFFKFCYVDFDGRTDVQGLFERYTAAFEKLRTQHPEVTFLHVTVPLTVTQGGIKGFLKDRFGKGAAGAIENARRHEFNELLRARYRGREPLFDLALAESVREDGQASAFERDGKTYPSLVVEFTDDGGHLNKRGRRHVARALAAALADAGGP
jgi:hypothetical protein